MKMQIIARTDTEVKFVVEDLTPQFANALRRIAMSDIPILAVEEVSFISNDSVLYDEVISHRLGTLPLKFDTKAFKMPGECSCEGKGCSNCQIVFVIDKKGPCMVYAKDMKSADAKLAEPLYPDTPIVELEDGQKLKVEAVAVLGLGRTHAKFQASRTHYRYFPQAKADGVKNPEECVKACPKRALSFDGKVNVTVDCDLCGECMNVCKPDGSLKITGDSTKFIFHVDSISSLSSDEIVLQAIEILKKKAKDFAKEAEKL